MVRRHHRPSPRNTVQAFGKDAAGRWQYRYHPGHTAHHAHAKFDRLISFGRALPALRQALKRDLLLPGLPRDKALACGVAIMATCFLRSGSEEYAELNGSKADRVPHLPPTIVIGTRSAVKTM